MWWWVVVVDGWGCVGCVVVDVQGSGGRVVALIVVWRAVRCAGGVGEGRSDSIALGLLGSQGSKQRR